jgi:hypothetical protein
MDCRAQKLFERMGVLSLDYQIPKLLLGGESAG